MQKVDPLPGALSTVPLYPGWSVNEEFPSEVVLWNESARLSEDRVARSEVELAVLGHGKRLDTPTGRHAAELCVVTALRMHREPEPDEDRNHFFSGQSLWPRH
jgi:hypothetical protein